MERFGLKDCIYFHSKMPRRTFSLASCYIVRSISNTMTRPLNGHYAIQLYGQSLEIVLVVARLLQRFMSSFNVNDSLYFNDRLHFP